MRKQLPLPLFKKRPLKEIAIVWLFVAADVIRGIVDPARPIRDLTRRLAAKQ